MRKITTVIAALALLMTTTAKAETVQWASYAAASSQYSTLGAAGAANPVIALLGPVDGAAFAVLGVVDPILAAVLCTVLSGTPCVPEDPEAFANEIAENASGLPDTLAGIAETFPAAFQAAVEAFPGNLEDALSTTPDAVVYGNWSAMQATGEPDTYPSCGDIVTAWAPLNSGAEPETLITFYDPPVADATRVDIYETNVGGFVTGVEVILAGGETEPVFTGPDTTPCAGILSIPLSAPNAVVAVVIHTAAPGFEEIDAVGVASGS